MTNITIRQRKDTPLTFKRSEVFAESHMTLITEDGFCVTVVLDIESSVQVMGQMDEVRKKPVSWWRELLSRIPPWQRLIP